jgi:hypothetical protein
MTLRFIKLIFLSLYIFLIIFIFLSITSKPYNPDRNHPIDGQSSINENVDTTSVK